MIAYSVPTMFNLIYQNIYLTNIFLLQTAGTLVLHASIPFVYLAGYSYFAFMEDPHGQYYQVSKSPIVKFSQDTLYIEHFLYLNKYLLQN